MNLSAVLGLIALVPAACNVPAALAEPLVLPLCSGDSRVLVIPVSPNDGPSPEPSACCAKACHTGCRKRGPSRQIDP